MKATNRLKLSADRQKVFFKLDVRDVHHWIAEISIPVILIVYDADKDTAYWLYVRDFFAAKKMAIDSVKKEISVRIPVANVVDESAIALFAQFRDDLLDQAKGKINHDG